MGAHDVLALRGDPSAAYVSHHQFALSAREALSRASPGTLDVYDNYRLQPMGAPANSRLICMRL